MNVTRAAAALRVPGARLHYDVSGVGPMLLIIQGGAGDADHSKVLVDNLRDRYTVVTYDRRGLSRSNLDSAESPDLGTHSDDAHRLLAAISDEPAFVLASSIGALIGLDLVTRHGEQVDTLIAHEPPALQLLPENEQADTVGRHQDVEETFRRAGVSAAMPKLLALVGLGQVNTTADSERWPPLSERQAANLEFYLTNDFPGVRHYQLDIAALKVASTRIVPAVGQDTAGLMDHRCAVELADQLDTAFVEFPGGHAGPATHPQSFAARLHEVLDRVQRTCS